MSQNEKIYEQLARTLAHLGHDTIFGLLGSGNFLSTNHFVSKFGGHFYWVRHEAAAVSAAATFAQVTGRLGIASVHQGPGLTNTLTTLAHAVRESSPVLLISGETGTGRQVNQTVDLAAIAAAAGAGVERVTDAATAAETIQRAAARAQEERRPIVLGLPVDVQLTDVPYRELPTADDAEPVRTVPGDRDIQQAVDIIQQSSRVVVLGGRGAVLSGAREALESLGEQVGALYATSLVANGLFANNPASLGVSGGFSTELAARVIPEADLIVAFGAALNHWTTMHGRMIDRSKVVLVDIDPADDTAAQVRLALRGDAAATAAALSQEIDRRGHSAQGFRGSAVEDELRSYDPATDFTEVVEPGLLDPRSLVVELNRVLPAERTVTYDSGHFHWFPTPYLTVPDPQGFVSAQGFQAVGIGFGVALGAAVARPDRVTLLLVGDGGTLMQLGEIDALVAQRARVVIAIFNDGAYGAEVHHFEPMGFSPELVTHGDRDLAGVARVLGATAATIRSTAELEPVLTDWLRDGQGPLVLDCKVNPLVRSERLQEAFKQE